MRLSTPCFLILALCGIARGQGYTIRTLARSATLNLSGSLAVDGAGNAYFAAEDANAVFRVDAITGQVTRFAGTGKAGYSGDNGPAVRAQLQTVMGLAVDADGNVYIGESGNRRIRKVSNGVIATFAGNGEDGYSGDGGPATSARLGALSGLAADTSGNVFIADNLNNVIRKVSNGVITTVAGNGTPICGSVPLDHSDDDGPAIGAQLYGPAAVAVDASGNLYIADLIGSRIRKVSDGRITTVAGYREANSYWGDDGPANEAGRQVSGGVIRRIAGEVGKSGYSGDNGPATSALLDRPFALAVDAAGRIYISDGGNNAIRVLVPDSPNEPLARHGALR
jgi:sugar lactone lactonase YvrE